MKLNYLILKGVYNNVCVGFTNCTYYNYLLISDELSYPAMIISNDIFFDDENMAFGVN